MGNLKIICALVGIYNNVYDDITTPSVNYEFINTHTEGQLKMFSENHPLQQFKIKGNWISAKDKKTAIKIRSKQLSKK